MRYRSSRSVAASTSAPIVLSVPLAPVNRALTPSPRAHFDANYQVPETLGSLPPVSGDLAQQIPLQFRQHTFIPFRANVAPMREIIHTRRSL